MLHCLVLHSTEIFIHKHRTNYLFTFTAAAAASGADAVVKGANYFLSS